jgi:very-short-patch-repair endonuclease
MICKICALKSKNALGMANHLRRVHDLSLLEYLVKHENFKIPKCACGKDCKIRKGFKFHKTCLDKECIKKINTRKHSEECKQRIKKARFEYLKKKTGKTAWENKSSGKMSYLEKWFFENVILKYDLNKKYDIINEYAFFPYFIDFAFTNIKLAVEMDGASHFKNGEERFKHDLKKDEFLLSQNWKVFRIAYNELTEEKVQEFLGVLENLQNYKYQPKVLEVFLYKGKEITKLKNEKKRHESKIRTEIRKNTSSKKTKQRIKKVLNSNIDFSKYGWVTKVAEILQMKSQKINSWMKKNMKEFYERNCFKKSLGYSSIGRAQDSES